MLTLSRFVTALILTIAPCALAQNKNAAESYPLHPDSQRQEGVPKGTVTKHTFSDSKTYPGTTRDFWVYVPAQYDKSADPACLMVFQDGGGAWPNKTSIRAAMVFDNLIHKGDMPDGALFFSDLKNGRIHKIGPGENALPEIWLENSNGTNGLAFDKNGRLYGCRHEAGQVVRWDTVTKKMEVLVENVKSNDIIIANDGTVYFTEPRANSVWCIPADGIEPFIAASDYSGVNGIALNPDQSLVYVADYSGRFVWSARRGKDGSLVHNQPFFHLHLPPASIDVRSQADGMCVANDGTLLVATAMGIQIAEPRNSTVIAILSPPTGARHPANLCFAADGSTIIAICGDKVFRRKTRFNAKN
jgi:sugar lactone lactonase YvrE